MIEQLFQEQHRSPEDAVAAVADGASKKRKVSPAIMGVAQTSVGYDDEDEYLSSDMGRGKKAKAGTGYAGLGKEDVSRLSLYRNCRN